MWPGAWRRIAIAGWVWWWLMLKHLVKCVWISPTWAMLTYVVDSVKVEVFFPNPEASLKFGIFHLADLPFFPLAPLAGDLSFRTRSISNMRCTRPRMPDRLWTGWWLNLKTTGFTAGVKNRKQSTRWAPSSYKWSYNPYKWLPVLTTLVIGVISPVITGRGPTL